MIVWICSVKSRKYITVNIIKRTIKGMGFFFYFDPPKNIYIIIFMSFITKKWITSSLIELSDAIRRADRLVEHLVDAEMYI